MLTKVPVVKGNQFDYLFGYQAASQDNQDSAAFPAAEENVLMLCIGTISATSVVTLFFKEAAEEAGSYAAASDGNGAAVEKVLGPDDSNSIVVLNWTNPNPEKPWLKGCWTIETANAAIDSLARFSGMPRVMPVSQGDSAIAAFFNGFSS